MGAVDRASGGWIGSGDATAYAQGVCIGTLGEVAIGIGRVEGGSLSGLRVGQIQ